MGNLRLYGSTSGYVEIAPPAVGGSQVLTLPTDSVQPGMVLVNTTTFSSASSISINNCFSSTYSNYRVIFDGYSSSASAGGLNMRLRSAGTDATGTSYIWGGQYITQSAGPTRNYSGGLVSLFEISAHANYATCFDATVFQPYVSSANTSFTSNYSAPGTASAAYGTSAGVYIVAAQHDGMTIYPGAGTVTGTIRIYGLRNS